MPGLRKPPEAKRENSSSDTPDTVAEKTDKNDWDFGGKLPRETFTVVTRRVICDIDTAGTQQYVCWA